MVGPGPRIPRSGSPRDKGSRHDDAAREPRASDGRATASSREARGSRTSGAPETPRARTGRGGVGPEAPTGGGSHTVAAPTPAHSFNGRLVALIVVATLIVFLAAPTAKIFFDQRAQISQLRSSIASEQDQQQQLKREEQLWGDDSYVEQQARERMTYVMPGESAYVVLGAQPGVHHGVESSAEQVEAGKPAWGDGLWQSVVDSAYPQQDVTLEPQPQESSDK
ncbi:FtsB family cell division protein [Kocuria varians]|uniref:FtsB family cell division protein n=1 Tax=Kocuria varians TaxID=1272 RepID=UPI000B057CB5|nr:septum formation initiator family protein [Kocuria varians]